MSRVKTQASNKNEEQDAWAHLVAAPLKDKKRFWRVIREIWSLDESTEKFQEQDVDIAIRLLGISVVALDMGKAEDLADLKKKAEALFGVEQWLRANAEEPLPKRLRAPDLTKTSPEEKKAFWNRVGHFTMLPGDEAGEYEEKKCELRIRFLTGLMSGFATFANLAELAELAESFVEAVIPCLATWRGSWSKEWDEIRTATKQLSHEEELAISEKMGSSLADFLKNRGKIVEAKFEALTDGLNPGEAADMEVFFSRFFAYAKTCGQQVEETLKESVLDEINKKLDVLQHRLTRFEDSEARLETIYNKIAVLTEIYGRQVEFGEAPPLPPVNEESPSKKELAGERERITGRVDTVLFGLFHKERKARGVTVARMMDIVLWKYFDKPTLSFELNDEQLPFGGPSGRSR